MKITLAERIAGICELYGDTDQKDQMVKQAILRNRRIKETDPDKLPYEEFLGCPYWIELSESLKWRAGLICEWCGAQKHRLSELEVHHKTYAHRGREYPDHLDDLVVLCGDCHTKHHEEEQSGEIDRESSIVALKRIAE